MVAVAGANLINSLIGGGMGAVSPMLGNVEEMTSSSDEDPMIAGYHYGTMEKDAEF